MMYKLVNGLVDHVNPTAGLLEPKKYDSRGLKDRLQVPHSTDGACTSYQQSNSGTPFPQILFEP